MSATHMALLFVIDIPICWLSWRYLIRPKLERMIRERSRYEISIQRRLG